MSVGAILLGIESLIFLTMGYLLYRDIKQPIVLFNLVWLIVALLMSFNPMGWYEISDKPFLIAVLGSFCFNYGAFGLNKVVLRKKFYRRDYDCANEILIKPKRLLFIQIILFIITVPLLIKAFAFLQIYGWHDMRYIYGNGIEYGYMTAFDRMFYVHIVVFPLMQACFYIQAVLFVKGKVPIWHLLVGIVDIATTIIITVGRWDIVYVMIAMFFAIKFRQGSVIKGLSKKAKRRLYVLAGAMVIVVVYVTMNRHATGEGIIDTLVDVLAGYFCCGLQLLEQMLKNASESGLNTFSFGGATLCGVFKVINVLLLILTFGKIQIPIVDVSRYSGHFFSVGAGKTMNAYVTWYYYFLRDFGILGVAFISALLGIIAVKIYKKAISYPSAKNQVIYLHMITILLFCSLWWEPIRMEVVAKILHNLWLMPFVGLAQSKLSIQREK